MGNFAFCLKMTIVVISQFTYFLSQVNLCKESIYMGFIFKPFGKLKSSSSRQCKIICTKHNKPSNDYSKVSVNKGSGGKSCMHSYTSGMCDYMIKNLPAQYRVNKLKENYKIRYVGVCIHLK